MKSEQDQPEIELPLINDLWNYNDAKGTEEKFLDLLPRAKSHDISYCAELLTQLARTQSLQRNFDKAHEYLELASELITPEMTVPQIRYHLEKGRTFNSNNEKVLASSEFKMALDIAVKNGQDFYAVDAAHMLGISDEPESRLNWTLKALELAEKSSDPPARNWRASLYNNIGWTYHDQEEFTKALAAFEKALDCRIEQGDTLNIFVAKWAIARTYRSLDRIDEAVDLQRQLLAKMEAGEVDIDGYVYEELAECLLIRGEVGASKKYFRQAFELLSKDIWLKANEKDRLNRLETLGK